MKNKVLLLLAVVSSLIATETETNPKNFMNKETVVAFDLHEVVLDRSLPRFFAAIGAFLAKAPFHHISLLNPVCGYRVYKILKSTSKTAENIYDNLTKHYPRLAETRKEFFDMCNMYDINPEMAQLVEELDAKGYRVAICSNIGEDVYNDFRQNHPGFFDKFKVVATSNRENNYLRKPAPKFFEDFKAACHATYGEEKLRFIFADDRKKNATAAEQCGLIGVCFKNHAQFRAELEKHGVLAVA